MISPSFDRETALYKTKVWPVAGVDEAGRGPLAGPVVAAAVILDPLSPVKGLADSKMLSAQQREHLFEEILQTAHVGIASVSAEEIDAINIRQATLLAMRRAVAALAHSPAYLLIDGNDAPHFACPSEAIIKGDATVASIAAASIVAKVMRDQMMMRLDELFPVYEFARHKGYGTKVHQLALKEHGPCAYHRRSFAPVRLALHPNA